MYILAIETSCDETSVAVCNDLEVLSNVVASQIEEHRLYGGVVPEIASRRHCECISDVCKMAMDQAKINYWQLDAVAVTYAPGLIGALLVGVNFAKGLAASLAVPLIPVHHLRSHIAANYISNRDLQPPFLCLLVSGGHSHLIEVKDFTKFKVIGRTRDDAAGECFDKAARAMGLSYPGGVELDKIADSSLCGTYKLPKPTVDGCPYDFSFSGLKTAVVNLIHNCKQKDQDINVPALAADLRKNVCDILIKKTFLAAEQFKHKKIVLAGGVSANSELRNRVEQECKNRGMEFYCPEKIFCGDNAAMVGIAAYYEFKKGNFAGVDLNAYATIGIE